MDEKEELFRYAPVKTAVAQMAVPSVISSLVLVVYNMADTYFVGQTHDAYQVAAVYLSCLWLWQICWESGEAL